MNCSELAKTWPRVQNLPIADLNLSRSRWLLLVESISAAVGKRRLAEYGIPGRAKRGREGL